MEEIHSYLMRRCVAGLIDATIIMLLGGTLMYLFWLLQASLGLTDLDSDRWGDLMSTLPVFFVEGITAVTAPICAAHFAASEAIVGSKLVMALWLLLSLSLTNWLYHALWESSSFRSTPGKLAVNLIVKNENGGRVSFGQASLRHFNKVISTGLLFVGFLAICWDAKRRAFHDRLSRCLVADGDAPQAVS